MATQGQPPQELLLVRIDHFRDRATYVSELRAWLQELQIANGRVITMGADLQLLFVAAREAQVTKLLDLYQSRNIDTNSRGELCVDKFIDVLGRKTVQSCGCKGFLEMNVLSPTLLQKVLVQDWHAEQQWLDAALATQRTKAFLDWKAAAKAARKQRRKKEGQEKQHERDMKRKKREQEALEKAAAKEQEDDAGVEVDEDLETEKNEEEEEVGKVDKEQVATAPALVPQPQQQQGQGQKRKLENQQSPASGPKKSKSTNKKRRNKPTIVSS
ncbi:hypothetical protein PHYPSEUDO_002960 [Phytophthora pseudosyringae]|uniref:RWD domain-containing protein n=1 Tax=Phytophthora pseudosyringae TaxID=221518 RepID=A0A8T1VRY7_9STRA|nr:hypothetical protein PHYPSEUDO_002960 [Phytophthora pseudosyringae]